MVVLFSFVFAGNLYAQAEGSFKDGPQYVYPMMGDVHDGQAGFGWQVAYQWTTYFSLEASVHRHKDRIGSSAQLPAPVSLPLDLEVVPVVLSARAGFPAGPFSFYAGGGLGWYYLRADAGDINRALREDPALRPTGVSDVRIGTTVDNRFAPHVAIGVECVLHKNWEIMAEYRLTFLDSTVYYDRTEQRPTPGELLAFEQSTTRTEERLDYRHGLLRIGLNYRF